MFMPDVRGRYQNTRLSAVVYCRRVWHQEAVHAGLYVYHHPAGMHPISNAVFAGYPQCRITVREPEFEQHWDRDPENEGRLLRLG